MPDYNRISLMCQRLVKNSGRIVTLIKLNETAADINKPWLGPSQGGEITLSMSAVFVAPNTVTQFGVLALGSGTEFKDLVTFSEKFLIVAQGDSDISGFTSVLDEGVRYGIVGMQILRPADKNLIAILGIRR